MNIRRRFETEFNNIREECESGDDILCDAMNCCCGIDLLRCYIADFLAGHFENRNLFFLTLYLDRDVTERGKLSTFDYRNSQRALKRYLKEAAIENLEAIGFIDIMLRQHVGEARHKPDTWHLHYHLIAISTETEKSINQKLESVIPASLHGARSSQASIMDNSVEYVVAYAVKYDFALKKKIHNGERQLKWTYRIQRRPREELDSFLQSITPFARIIHLKPQW